MDFLQMSLSASALILIIVVIRTIALHKLPKKTFLVLWGVVVFRLLVPFSIPSRFSLYTGLSMLKGLFAGDSSFTPTMETADILSVVNIPYTREAVDVANAVFISPIRIVWLIGMCACMLFFIVTYSKCVKQFKMSLPVQNEFATLWLQEHSLSRPVQIRQSDRIKAPLTFGIFHPVILLPKNTDWKDENELRYVLAHEFTHIRRFDTLSKLVMTIAVCIHWFNPLVWVMCIVANRDIELSCDESVVRSEGFAFGESYGEITKSAYARTLINLEATKGYTPFVNNFSKNAIEERIEAIMKTKKVSFMAIALAALIVTTTTTVFGTNALAAEPEKNVKFAETVTNIDENDSAFTVNPSAVSFSFPKEQRSSVESHNHSINFDVEKAIADVEAGVVKPLANNNLPTGISKDDVMSITNEDGSTLAVTLNDVSARANCSHVYTPGIFGVHSKASDGSCSYTTYEALRCSGCNTYWLLEVIGTTTNRVCPH